MDQLQSPERSAPVISFIKPEERTNFCLAMNQRLDRLYQLGVLGVRMRVGEDGLTTYDGIPDEAPEGALRALEDHSSSSGKLMWLGGSYRMMILQMGRVPASKVHDELNLARLKCMEDLKLIKELHEDSLIPTFIRHLEESYTFVGYLQAMARIIKCEKRPWSVMSAPGWWKRNKKHL
ncbi:hypothetical protein FGADI_9103 [Fusarium gaditjirri]|uniref:Uncharacterized protein n=1 Tax=Fusarium gaditjirri TaxID=282569 RepID=A0A8H4WT94_9HYPO|nr:hypothetical protein FGADI_9103 [Fusarium gaditjirri]